jgi:hypothetical protein
LRLGVKPQFVAHPQLTHPRKLVHLEGEFSQRRTAMKGNSFYRGRISHRNSIEIVISANCLHAKKRIR